MYEPPEDDLAELLSYVVECLDLIENIVAPSSYPFDVECEGCRDDVRGSCLRLITICRIGEPLAEVLAEELTAVSNGVVEVYSVTGVNAHDAVFRLANKLYEELPLLIERISPQDPWGQKLSSDEVAKTFRTLCEALRPELSRISALAQGESILARHRREAAAGGVAKPAQPESADGPATTKGEQRIEPATESELQAKRLEEQEAAAHSIGKPQQSEVPDRPATAPDGRSEILPGRKESKTGRALKRPSEKAMQAWRLRDLTGINNQTELAKEMTRQGVPATQGQVSRWLAEVEAYLEAGGVFPQLKPPTREPDSVDPAVIDMGKRQDRRTGRQRPRRDPDSSE